MNDEGFREIQLNGKQLVFLFMAVTVVSVLIFLFGVLVGRGARTPRMAEVAGEVAPDPGLAPAADTITPPPADAIPPTAENPAAKPAEELSYAERLLHDAPIPENLDPSAKRHAAPPPPPAPAAETPVQQKPAAQPPATAQTQKPVPAQTQKPVAQMPPAQEPVAVTSAPARATAAPTPPPKPAAAPPPPPKPVETVPTTTAQSTDPSGPGFAVQVAAYRDRRESDTLAKQLIAKGYPAFVMDPVKGAPTAFFRVRVGKYKTLKDAQAVMAQLQAEQFSSAWIAR